MAERFIESKTKTEEDAAALQKLTEDNQHFEEENHMLADKNTLLQVFIRPAILVDGH